VRRPMSQFEAFSTSSKHLERLSLVSRDEEEALPMTLTHVNAPTGFVEANERGAHGSE
jgi:hypothetical protein